MKFRQFEFSFFPRIRGKKKKKSKYSNTSLDRNFPVDKNFNYSKIGYDNAVVKRTTAAAFDNGNDVYGDGLKYLRSNSDYSEYRDDSCYSQTYPLQRLTLDVGSCCSCDVCADAVADGAVAPLYCISSVQTPVGTPLCTRNTIPRTRTRIKTNPWLPSPRTTPSLSPAGTIESFLYSSSEFQYRSTSSDYQISSKDHSSVHSLAQVHQLGDEPTNLSKVTEECFDDVENFNESVDDVSKLKASKRLSFTEFLKYDSDDSNCASPVTEQIEIVSKVNCKISFKYEENMDDMLESQDIIPRDETFLSIKDLIEDDYQLSDKSQAEVRDELDQIIDSSEADNNAEIASGTVLSKIMETSISSSSELSDVISNMDLTFYDEGYMLESIDTGYGSAVRDSDENSETGEFEPHERAEEKSSDEAELEWDNDPSAHNLQGSENNKFRTYGAPEASDKMACKNCSRARSRSLADIEASLDEKVSLLREEKYFVQRKIREAKEEEEIRHQQVQLFRSYSVDNRKEVLLQTLHDLKTRLENQSARLQSSYDTVLSLQRTFSKKKSKLPTLETVI